MRRSFAPFLLMLGRDAIGDGVEEAEEEWIARMADAFDAAKLAAAIVVPSTVGESAATEHEVKTRIEPSAFDRGIDRLRSLAVRSGADIDRIRQEAEEHAQRIAKLARGGKAYQRRVERLRRLIEVADNSFWIRGVGATGAGRVRDVIVKHLRQEGGSRPPEYHALLTRIDREVRGGRALAETIVRTNVVRVYNDAHADRLADPRVKKLVPLVMLVEIHDERTRGAPHGIYGDGGRNPGAHWQMNGLIGTIEQFREWRVVPPCGYNCRGSIRGLPLAELEEMGLLRSDLTPDWPKIRRMNASKLAIVRRGAYPDPGFRPAF